jgi:hypothetical protein
MDVGNSSLIGLWKSSPSYDRNLQLTSRTGLPDRNSFRVPRDVGKSQPLQGLDTAAGAAARRDSKQLVYAVKSVVFVLSTIRGSDSAIIEVAEL